MDALTLLIADSDEAFRHALSLALQDFFYIRTCQSGTQALALLRSTPVHILVVDLLLPELDGLALLETLAREGICPEVLAVGAAIPDNVLSGERELDIRCLLRKPCSLHTAVEIIQSLRRELQNMPLPEKHARQLLRQLHILPKYDGHAYLLHALPALAQDPKRTITKHLYADTAKAYSCTAKCVEHSIRHVIGRAWNLYHNQAWDTFFPRHQGRPTNGEFLQTIAWEMRKNLE